MGPIKNCRLCDSPKLSEFIDFGNVALGNNLLIDPDEAVKAATYRLNVFQCNVCSHFQLGYSVDPQILYATNYTYLSGIGESFRKHIKAYAKDLYNQCSLNSDSLILDVGSNDGTCLSEFKALGCRVHGVDPALLPSQIANSNGIPTLNMFFGNDAKDILLKECGQFDLVTSQNVLAHVDDLRGVFKSIYEILKDDGFFSFEVGYFVDVLKSNCFDTIYHEHLDYHHAEPLQKYLTSIGFDVVKLTVNKMQGGTLGLLLKKTGQGKISSQANEFINIERRSVIKDKTFLSGWSNKIHLLMEGLGDLIISNVAVGKKVVAYGAPTKATLLMKLSKLSRVHISYVAEDNLLKVSRYLPGSAIPIKSAKEFMADNPDLVLIFAWNFADDIIKKLRHKHKSKFQIVIPLPNLRVVNSNDDS